MGVGLSTPETLKYWLAWSEIQMKKMSNEKPYLYVRFVWWKSHNLEELATKLKERFTLVSHTMLRKKEQSELAIHKDSREEIQLKADTLSALLSKHRAALFQKQKVPFTRKDMELRKKILDLYPRDSPTPFPWSFSSEPKFEKEQ